MSQDVFKRVSDRMISGSDLKSEINKLGGVTEPPSFWSDIANDQTYSAGHRAASICQFFRRHINASLSLVELAKLLDYPEWINLDTVTTVAHLRGEIPVAWHPGETVFAVRLFPGEVEASLVLYIRISQPLEAETFVRIMRASNNDATATGANVLEAACGGNGNP